MNIDELIGLAYNAGFRNDSLIIAVCIAMAESSGNENAVGDVSLVNAKWGPSIGLWQIRSLHTPEKYGHPDTLRIYKELFNPANHLGAGLP